MTTWLPKGDRNRKRWPTPFCGTLSFLRLSRNFQLAPETATAFSSFLIFARYEPFSGEWSRPLTPILLKSTAIHLQFLSRYFCTPPGRKCNIHHQFASRYGYRLHRDAFEEVSGSGSLECLQLFHACQDRWQLGVLSHHLKCEMKSSHLVDFSWDFVDF